MVVVSVVFFAVSVYPKHVLENVLLIHHVLVVSPVDLRFHELIPVIELEQIFQSVQEGITN